MSRLRLVDPRPFERVMVFIDGGYLRELCRKYGGHDRLDLEVLRDRIVAGINNMENNPFQANLIRIYYYDAIVDRAHPDYDKQRKHFDEMNCRSFTIKLGELVESSNKGFRQKGVDILMAIDSLTKAYQNQYDVAAFLLGDRDFIPLIEAIKDTGKKTLCMVHIANCAPELIRRFDIGLRIEKENIDLWLGNKMSIKTQPGPT